VILDEIAVLEIVIKDNYSMSLILRGCSIRCVRSRSHATRKRLEVCTVGANCTTGFLSFAFSRELKTTRETSRRTNIPEQKNSQPYGDVEPKAKVLMHVNAEGKGDRQRASRGRGPGGEREIPMLINIL